MSANLNTHYGLTTLWVRHNFFLPDEELTVTKPLEDDFSDITFETESDLDAKYPLFSFVDTTNSLNHFTYILLSEGKSSRRLDDYKDSDSKSSGMSGRREIPPVPPRSPKKIKNRTFRLQSDSKILSRIFLINLVLNKHIPNFKPDKMKIADWELLQSLAEQRKHVTFYLSPNNRLTLRIHLLYDMLVHSQAICGPFFSKLNYNVKSRNRYWTDSSCPELGHLEAKMTVPDYIDRSFALPRILINNPYMNHLKKTNIDQFYDELSYFFSSVLNAKQLSFSDAFNQALIKVDSEWKRMFL